jgi:hypothetical protein
MIEAELFDGTILEFPDGTAPAVIQRVAKEQTLARKTKPAAAGGQSVPAMGLPENPKLLETGPGPTGAGMSELYDQGILPRRFVAGTGANADPAPVPDALKVLGAGVAGFGRGVAGAMDMPGAAGRAGASMAGYLAEKLGVDPARVDEALMGVKQLMDMTPLGSGTKALESLSTASDGMSEYRVDTTCLLYTSDAADDM